MAQAIKVGTYTGTGAAVTVSLGFTPDYIKVVNVTDGDDIWEWYSGMTAAHAIWQRNIVDSGVTGNNAIARITANGISQYAGSSTPGSLAAKGVTFGSALSESGDTFAYLAVRNTQD